MIKPAGLKIAGALLNVGCIALLIVAMAALVAGCAFTHDPRIIRIDNVGAKGLDSPQELTDSQKERIVELILNAPEAREQPPTQSVYRTWLTWTAIAWDDSHYSYMCSFDFEGVERLTQPIKLSRSRQAGIPVRLYTMETHRLPPPSG